MRKACLVIVVALALPWLSATAAERHLASGQTVEILNIGRTVQDGEWSFLLRYRTAAALDDETALRAEADELWHSFVGDADNAHFPLAVIRAVRRDQTGAVSGTHDTVYRQLDNHWRTIEPNRETLDESFAASFVSRFDWLDPQRALSRTLLYLGDDWTLTFLAKDRDVPLLPSYERDQLKVARMAFGIWFRNLGRREEVRVTLAEEGHAATVESERAAEMLINGRIVPMRLHMTDKLRLDAGMVLVTESTAMVERQAPRTASR